MKTTIQRIKNLLSTNSALSYIRKFEFVSPKLLPNISSSEVPYIGIAPVSTSESWVAQRKQAIHTVDIYIVDWLQVNEAAIIGDSVKKGLLEIVTDVSGIIRSNFLASGGVNYLSKPTEILTVDYVVTGYGDNVFLFVASMMIQCVTLFNTTVS